MQIEDAQQVVERLLPPGSMTTLRREILRSVWLGQSYADLARQTGNDHDYIRRVGAELWRALGVVLGQDVGKSNVRALIEAGFPAHPADGQLPVGHSFPGGPLPVDSPLYIPPADLPVAVAELERPGGLVRIQAPRSRGKSSLALRLAREMESRGGGAVYLDCRLLSAEHFHDPDRLLRWFAAGIARAVGLDPVPAELWTPSFGPAVDCLHYLERAVLPRVTAPLLIVLDDMEPVLAAPESARFFLPFLRSAFEESRHRETFGRLRWVLAYPTEAFIPLELHASPFNVGLPVRLPTLTPDDIRRLARHYGLEWDAAHASALVSRLSEFVAGHPYLVQLALYHLSGSAGQRPAPGPRTLLEADADFQAIFASHLRTCAEVLRSNARLAQAMESAVTGAPAAGLDPALLWQLEALGLAVRRGDRLAAACPLYAALISREYAG